MRNFITPTNTKLKSAAPMAFFKTILAIFFVALSFTEIHAQDCTPTQIHVRDGGSFDFGNDPAMGQTFTACADVEITTISVTANSGSTTPAGTYNLYIYEDVAGGNQTTGTVLASTTFASAPDPLQVMTFNLGSPFIISNGTIYRFVIDRNEGSITLRYELAQDYAGGNLIFNNGTVSNFDLDFEIITQDITPLPPPSVPTLSEWGLIVLALLLMTLGTLYLLNPKFSKGVSEK